MKTKLTTLPLQTPDGTFLARYSEKGLAGLEFPSHGNGETPSPQGVMPAQIRQWHRKTAAALKRSLAGRAPGILPPLDLSSGTDFQQHVWGALREICSGKTRSYGEIARAIGKPKAVRAVGGACGANPIPVFVPCHRVLAADQKIGGFSSGLDWKRRLLAREGIVLTG